MRHTVEEVNMDLKAYGLNIPVRAAGIKLSQAEMANNVTCNHEGCTTQARFKPTPDALPSTWVCSTHSLAQS